MGSPKYAAPIALNSRCLEIVQRYGFSSQSRTPLFDLGVICNWRYAIIAAGVPIFGVLVW